MKLFSRQRQRIAERILDAMAGHAINPSPRAVDLIRWLGLMPGAQVVPRFVFTLSLWDLLREGKLQRRNRGFALVG